MSTAEKYLLGAYLVFLAAILAYVLIFATKLARLEREVAELVELAAARRDRPAGAWNEEPVAPTPVRAGEPRG